MDNVARNNLNQAVQGQLLFLDKIKGLLARGGLYTYGGTHYWDAVLITHIFERSLLQAAVGLRYRLPWTTALCSALVDEGVYARGLLMHAARLCNDLGLVGDALQFGRLRDWLLRGRCNNQIIVAYFDHLNTTHGSSDVWQTFADIGRKIALVAVEHGFASYYWRSSDTFYIYRVVSETDVADKCASLVDLLLRIQRELSTSGKWRWQMGVSLGTNTGLGDIFLPGKDGMKAAKLMGSAIDRLRGGGALCVTKEFWEALPQSYKNDFMALMEEASRGYVHKCGAHA